MRVSACPCIPFECTLLYTALHTYVTYIRISLTLIDMKISIRHSHSVRLIALFYLELPYSWLSREITQVDGLIASNASNHTLILSDAMPELAICSELNLLNATYDHT